MAELIFVANWKMNMLQESTRSYASAFAELFRPRADGHIDTVFCPPFSALVAAKESFARLKGCALGSQNVHWLDSGPHTGEVSAPMLKELGVQLSIIGHSERRQVYGENDKFVSKRAKAAIAHGLRPIVCVGEASYFENSSDETFSVIREQLHGSLDDINAEEAKQLIIAYEPVWAIGTGRAATPEIVRRMHTFIRSELQMIFEAASASIPILYGGSTTAENIASIVSQPNVNGALVGSSSLKPESFTGLIFNGREAQGVRF